MSDSISRRIWHALIGGSLGALAIFASTYWVEETNTTLVISVGGVCAVLSFLWGRPFIEWLSDKWWRF